MTNDVILQMKQICKSYKLGDEDFLALKDVDIEVRRGEFISILGPSGSGKTTLMNIIGCLDTPTSGSYLLEGLNVLNLNEAKISRIRNKQIGFIFQQFQLLKKFNALENVELPLVYNEKAVKHSIRRERATKILSCVGLADKATNLPNQLSGGQQQRVAIARALVNNPSILLADEPTGALDFKTGQQIMELFKQLNQEGKTIIMITHDANIAKYATRIVNIFDGRISEEANV